MTTLLYRVPKDAATSESDEGRPYPETPSWLCGAIVYNGHALPPSWYAMLVFISLRGVILTLLQLLLRDLVPSPACRWAQLHVSIWLGQCLWIIIILARVLSLVAPESQPAV